MKFDELKNQLRDVNCSNEAIALALDSGKRTLEFPRKNEKKSLEDGVIIAARLYDMFHGLNGRNIFEFFKKCEELERKLHQILLDKLNGERK